MKNKIKPIDLPKELLSKNANVNVNRVQSVYNEMQPILNQT